MSTLKVVNIQHPSAASATLILDSSGNLALPAGSASTPALQGPSDTNTGLFFPAADTIAFAEGGTEALRIDSSGRVGIGTSSPGHALHVVGASTLLANGNADVNQYFYSTGYGTKFEYTTGNISIRTNSADRLTVTYGGSVGIGTTSPARTLHVAGSAVFADTVDTTVWAQFSTGVGGIGTNNNYPFAFATNGTERARIDSSGRLLVGTSTARANLFNASTSPALQIEGTSANTGSLSIIRNQTGSGPLLVLAASGGSTLGSNTVVANNYNCGYMSFQGSDGTEFVEAAAIQCEIDGTPGANDMPGRLVFSTTADGASSPTERMRITQAGKLFFGTTTESGAGGLTFLPAYSNGATALIFNRSNTTNQSSVLVFQNNGTDVGSIYYTNTATTYATSSDYRLKENVVPVSDGIDRLKQLKPSRFNFIIDPTKTVDGFIAHEVQGVVPEAIGGTKDEVDADGKPIYQNIDQSKLVPLLTAALQEAVAKIESLEARLIAAGI